MKRLAALFLLVSGLSLQADAQSFLDELKTKKQGEGTVTVTQSKEIDDLVNSAKLVNTPQVQEPSHSVGKRPTEKREVHTPQKALGDSAHEARKEHERTPESAERDIEEAPYVNTAKKVMRNSRKITGYRVQAYSGGNTRADRQAAERIKNAIKMKYPELPIYVHFYSPRWICRVGNFRTYQEAESVLKKIKAMGYRQACIVKGKITVAY